jgi:hypothetical protein
MPPPPRIRPYKDFLTPALHRRFALASATLFLICYVEAIVIGEWNSSKIHNRLEIYPLMSFSDLVLVAFW